ncbi:mitochondrial substrate carrier family protein L-like [Sycon ciliatum]|uniref:mitochondrial substrate carrier family protein L-like n=1 Tax=Sycon ciliatum TaxID=27933 RepID=UPI0020ACAD85|eukprot:scpid74483/ scgid6010/ Mitochondrial substrate carrier family protein L
MTHSEKRGAWYLEGGIGLGVGVLYGTTNVCVGHPFDTIKTKMQAQKGFEGMTMAGTFKETIRKDGFKGLYRGCVPPLWGSGIYRSSQFAVFEAVYTYLDTPVCKWELPGTGGLQLRVLLGGAAAATTRAVIECPLEVAKVRRQTGQSWEFKSLYKGFTVTWIRTLGLMSTYFILVDSQRRHNADLFKSTFVGPFLVSGVSATLAWWLVWPFEYMKSQVQSNYGKDMSLFARMRMTMRERGGFFALYRGIGPGSIRSFLANGCSMIVMANAQRYISHWGLR